MNNTKYFKCSNAYNLLKNKHKYKGTLPIQIRSSWEASFIFKYLDINENIIQWTSETVIIKYLSPIDGKYHRYFIDFSFKAKAKDNNIQEFWVEIKPFAQTELPKVPKKKTINYAKAIQTYIINKAKWDTTNKIITEKQQAGKNIKFIIITEKDCPWFLT